jgi:hypothetical protein
VVDRHARLGLSSDGTGDTVVREPHHEDSL